jgi:hypothetical protein
VQPTVVQVLDRDRTTSQCGQEIDLGAVVQVVSLALEPVVLLLLDDEHDVSGDDVGALVTLSAKGDLLAILHTLVDGDVENLALGDCLLSVALLAPVLVLDDLALAVTIRADGLEALDHGAHLAHHGLHAGTVAAAALPNRALLATPAFALGADHTFLKCKLADLTLVKVFERYLVVVDDVAALHDFG